MDLFIPYLTKALANVESPTCSTAVGLVADLAQSLGPAISPYLNGLMEILGANLNNPTVKRELKPAIVSCFGDIASVLGENFQPYMQVVMQIVPNSLVLAPTDNTYESIDYVNSSERKQCWTVTLVLSAACHRNQRLSLYHPLVLFSGWLNKLQATWSWLLKWINCEVCSRFCWETLQLCTWMASWRNFTCKSGLHGSSRRQETTPPFHNKQRMELDGPETARSGRSAWFFLLIRFHRLSLVYFWKCLFLSSILLDPSNFVISTSPSTSLFTFLIYLSHILYILICPVLFILMTSLSHVIYHVISQIFVVPDLISHLSSPLPFSFLISHLSSHPFPSHLSSFILISHPSYLIFSLFTFLWFHLNLSSHFIPYTYNNCL